MSEQKNDKIIYTENGELLPEFQHLRRDDCAACKEDIPFIWNSREEKFVHLDLFATGEAGAMYDCPCEYAPGEENAEAGTPIYLDEPEEKPEVSFPQPEKKSLWSRIANWLNSGL